MARLTGPDESCRVVYLTTGTNKGKASAQGMSVPLYADEALTTPADVLSTTGDDIAESTVLVDAFSKIPLVQYPDGVDTIWTSINGGPAMPLRARFDDRLDALEAAVEDLQESGAVDTDAIADDAVTAAKIAPDAVGTSEIAADAVTSAEIAAGAVGASEIADGSVGTSELADDAVTAAKIAPDAVGTSEIAADAVTSAEIAADAVGTSEIAPGAVTTTELADDAVTAAKIAPDAVGTSEIANDAVTAAKIAADAVGTSEIAPDAVTASEIAAGAVGASEIADGSVGTTELADDAVTAAKIAPDAVGTSEIATDAVTSAEIAAGAVGASEIADGAVGTVELADSAVTSAKIADGTIVDGDVSPGAVFRVSAAALGIYSPLDPAFGYTSGAELAASSQAAINAMPSSGAFRGGNLQIPPGNWTFNTAVALKSGVRVTGASRFASRINGNVAGVFTWISDLNNVVIEHLNLVCTAGHIFNPTGGAANWGWYTSKVQDCNLTVTDVNGSIVNHVSNRDYDNVQFLECDFTRGAGSLVPGFNIVNSAGAANQNTWRDCWAHSSNSTGAPMFWVESTSDQNYAYGNVFENITGEQCAGGLIDLRSNHSPIIKNCFDFDTQVTYTADIIRIGKSTALGGLPTLNPMIEVSGRRDNVTLPGAIYDINLVPGDCKRATVIIPNHSSSKFKMNWADSDGHRIFGMIAGAGPAAQPADATDFLQTTKVKALYIGDTTTGVTKKSSGTASPEGVVTGSPGDEYTRTDGTGSTVKYIKRTGVATTTGWFSLIGIPPACTLTGGRRPLSGAPYPLPVSTGTWAKDNWRYMPMTLADNLPVSFLSALCSVAPTGGTALMRFALYDLDQYGRPSTLHTDYGSYGTIDLTVGAGGESTLATASLIIPAGRWAIGCAWTGTASTSATMFTNTGAHPGVASNSIVTLGNAWQESVSGASAPSPAVVSAVAVAGIAVYGVMA